MSLIHWSVADWQCRTLAHGYYESSDQKQRENFHEITQPFVDNGYVVKIVLADRKDKPNSCRMEPK